MPRIYILSASPDSSSLNSRNDITRHMTDTENNLDKILKFVYKIAQTVLRARAKSTLNPSVKDIGLETLQTSLEFWKSGLPVHIDIFSSKSKLLLERWVVSYEERYFNSVLLY